MAKYWEKRPEFEAVQIKPENLEQIKEMTGADVAFSEKLCYMYIYDRLSPETLGIWLIRKPNGQLILCGNHDFEEMYEPVASKNNIVLVQNNPKPPQMRGE
jgi:hypothetical protein